MKLSRSNARAAKTGDTFTPVWDLNDAGIRASTDRPCPQEARNRVCTKKNHSDFKMRCKYNHAPDGGPHRKSPARGYCLSDGARGAKPKYRVRRDSPGEDRSYWERIPDAEA